MGGSYSSHTEGCGKLIQPHRFCREVVGTRNGECMVLWMLVSLNYTGWGRQKLWTWELGAQIFLSSGGDSPLVSPPC